MSNIKKIIILIIALMAINMTFAGWPGVVIGGKNTGPNARIAYALTANIALRALTTNIALTANYTDWSNIGNKPALVSTDMEVSTANYALTASSAIEAGSASLLGGKAEGALAVSTANVALTANAVLWTGVSERPTGVSQFSNDSQYLTANGIINTALQALTANYAITANIMNAQGLLGAITVATDNAVLSITTAGNVGIGTSSPTATLHVAGFNVLFGATATTTGAFAYNGAGSNQYFGVYDATSSLTYGISRQLPSPLASSTLGGYYKGLGIGGSTNNTFNPIFGILTSTQSGHGTGHTAFTVYDTNKVLTYYNVLDNGSGNMGIGTTSPVANLQVSGNTAGTPILLVGNGTAPSALIVSNNGNVGIGTATPSATLEVNGTFVALVPINAQTVTSYTLAASDNSKLLTMDNASAITVTIPVNASVSIPVGFQCTIVRKGTGTVTLSKASGVTVISTSTALTFTATGSAATLIKVATDQWLAFGDLN